MELTPFTPSRFTESMLYTFQQDGAGYFVKVYLGENAGLRRDLELSKLNQWSCQNFPVPKVNGTNIPRITDPYLIMEFIQGISLSYYLKDESFKFDIKINLLKKIFLSNYKRHQSAIKNNDKLLVHSDPNTDNIIVSGEEFHFIDFEHPGKKRHVLDACANEAASFCRRVVRDLGRSYLINIMTLFYNIYATENELLTRVEALTYNRSFHLVHRIKDRLKKAKNSELVTRYDVADALHELR